MKVAIVSNPRHRRGDLMEFLLLRAMHAFNEVEPADLLIVEGELGEADEGFLSAFFASAKLRKRSLLPVWLARNASPLLPAVPERIAVNGVEESPAALVGRIRAAAGGMFPEFCRAPFETTVAEVAADGTIRTSTIPMVIEPVPGLTDFHIHTRLAYCGENIDIPKALEMAKLSNVEMVAFIEHSGHLYFSKEDYRASRYVWRTRDTASGCAVVNRMAEYEEVVREGAKAGTFLHGFELDVDRNGDVILEDVDRRMAQVRIGAVHHLEERCDSRIADRQFLLCTKALLNYGVHILAHPFRIFAWAGFPRPKELYEPVAELLRRSGTAAEINFHCNFPDPEFFDICIKKGVKISFGSDSHNLYEVGFFLPHYRLLAELGVTGRLDEVLYRFPQTPDKGIPGDELEPRLKPFSQKR